MQPVLRRLRIFPCRLISFDNTTEPLRFALNHKEALGYFGGCESHAQTTVEMVACYTEGSDRWDRELNRFYAELMASLNPTQKQSVQAAQRAWLQYRDAQGAALGAVDNEGTQSRVSRAAEAMLLTKQQPERLARLLAR